MKKKLETLQDLIAFVKDIPEENLIPGKYEGVKKGTGCIMGHLHNHFVGEFEPENACCWPNADAEADKFILGLGIDRVQLATINNTPTNYGFNTRKEAILSLLYKHEK